MNLGASPFGDFPFRSVACILQSFLAQKEHLKPLKTPFNAMLLVVLLYFYVVNPHKQFCDFPHNFYQHYLKFKTFNIWQILILM